MEVLSGVHAVPSIRLSRIYLIEGEQLVLIDSGLPWNVGTVMRYISSIGRRPEELALVLMTHSHPDHSTGAHGISKRTGAEIVAHAADTSAHAGRESSLSYMRVFTSLPVPVPFLRRTPVARLVEDGEVLQVLGGIRVIHSPGHTPGSVCYLLEGRSLLFSGDTAFSDGRRISRSLPFFGSHTGDYRRSLDRLAQLEFDTMCGGHGEPLVGGASDKLRELLISRPDPPTWPRFLGSVPARLLRARGFSGGDF